MSAMPPPVRSQRSAFSPAVMVSRAATVALLLLAAPTGSWATGYSGPNNYLDDGGTAVTSSPEFYWADELLRLAREYDPKEEFKGTEAFDAEGRKAGLDAVTRQAEKADLEDALKSGTLKPASGTTAGDVTEAFEKARAVIEAIGPESDLKALAALIDQEPASEFADYQRGALYYRAGQWDEARAAWAKLLERPKEERHYRSVWAAFMLGKLELKKGDAHAPAWFQRTRELARAGLADSLGMAADSYGWEARSQWKQGHPEKAAPLYLTQLSLGDGSAVESLKALIPDRQPVEGMLNYGPEPEERDQWTDEEKKAHEKKTAEQLAVAARDPLLRRLVTLHILSVETSGASSSFDGVRPAVGVNPRCARWLAAIERVKPGQVSEAEYLGWVAYTAGDYRAAERWLALSAPKSPAAFWLRAKLEWRAGKTAEAAQAMARAWKGIYTPEKVDTETDSDFGGGLNFASRASGDLAAMHLGRGDFIQALEMFDKGLLQSDAAYLAERVLTTPELIAYVRAHREPEPSAKKSEGESETGGEGQGQYRAHGGTDLSYLLGRRLVREGRLAEAEPYFPPDYGKLLKAYRLSLATARNEKAARADRLQAWSFVAWLARHDGMELMGTEVAPDVFLAEGQFTAVDLASQRRAGRVEHEEYPAGGGDAKKVLQPIVLKATKGEVERLRQTHPMPDVRFHYRVLAAQYALEAAKLLPDGSEELADLLNRAGQWADERDVKLANQCYQLIEQRAARTTLGKEVLGKKWFTETEGPWSEEQRKTRAEARKSAGFEE